MINFLIHRPIAVSMTILAFLMLGVLSMRYLPVSLMPNIDIPEITVKVNSPNTSARELENAIVKKLRSQLMQVGNLYDMTSETYNEYSIIKLQFNYGTDIDFAFIEVNEKIDHAMNLLPRDLTRPQVIKASATDIPVFYLNLSNRVSTNSEVDKSQSTEQNFIELSRFARQVIRKRLEQLSEVAMVDISGLVNSQILVIPNKSKLKALNLSLQQLEKYLQNNNLKLGNLLIKDGQYQYNVRFSSSLSTIRDIENVHFNRNGRLFQLKDVADVLEQSQPRQGMIISNGQQAVSLAIIKQSDAQLKNLKESLYSLMDALQNDYPEINFTIIRDQTALLDYSISNLGMSLVYGAVLAFLVMFFFLRDYKVPFLIGLSVPVSLILALLFFYLFDISINIISISGLILGVGMMIDNSIIVIDNITQHRERGSQLNLACIRGTNEVFRPLLSSVLTTCAVFIPLIFISGMAGAMFYDQAIAVSVGLFTSLLVSVTLLPVFYRLFYLHNKTAKINLLLKRLNTTNYENWYEKGFRWVMRHQALTWVIFVSLLMGAFVIYRQLPKYRLPEITKSEIILYLDWNQSIGLTENQSRIQALMAQAMQQIDYTAFIGRQDYLLNQESEAGSNQTYLYLKFDNQTDLEEFQSLVPLYLSKNHVEVIYDWQEADNIFNVIFPEQEAPLLAKIRPVADLGVRGNQALQTVVQKINEQMPEVDADIPWQEQLVISVDPQKILLLEVDFQQVYNRLANALNQREVFTIIDNQNYTPVILGSETTTFQQIISQAFVRNKHGELYPLRELINLTRDRDLKHIIAGREGEYFPVRVSADKEQVPALMQKIEAVVENNALFEVDFTGQFFSNQELLKEMLLILSVSMMLLYFILAAQFESFSLPLIVLLEVPIDIFGAFFLLWHFGESLNLMSMIGIIVISGIVINDSILKIDTINQLRKRGFSLLRALQVAGKRRLKPILMTSITTVLALLPVLLSEGIGAELQKPFALAVIGGMLLGTVVSLYFIPLCYYYLMKVVDKR
jgi:multidrug efflux pump subunit AcrB